MKLLSILIITLSLSACSMSIEEYNARVKYCKDNGMGVKTYTQNTPTNAVSEVRCVSNNGETFQSKEKQ